MKAKLSDITINENNMERVAFAETIDFTELFDHVTAFANVGCNFFQPEISTNRSDVYITFMSDDITAQTGPFAAILKHCYIYSFSNSVFRDKNNGEIGYWVSVNIRYEHKDGGSNGMEMVRALFRNGKWEFSDAGQRR